MKQPKTRMSNKAKKKLKDLKMKDLPKKLKKKQFKIDLKRKKPNVKLKLMLKKLKKKELKQKKLKSLLSKQILLQQMYLRVKFKYRIKNHYRKLKRRNLQRKRKQLSSSSSSNLMIKIANVLRKKLLSEQIWRDLQQKRPKDLKMKDLLKKLNKRQSKIVLKQMRPNVKL